MDIFEALDTLEEANIIVERKSVKEMTPEEYKADLEARRERRRLRKERPANIASANSTNSSSKSEPGDWYIMGNMSPMPEKIKKGAKINSFNGRGTAEIEGLKEGQSCMIGPFSDKSEAVVKAKKIYKKIVEFLEEKIDKKEVDFTDEDSRYRFREYTVDKFRNKLFIVNLSDKNKKWCSARLSPFDGGYWYDSDKEATEAIRKPMERFLKDFEEKCEKGREAEEKRNRRSENYRSSWDPNAGNFRNVFCHH